jgi:hypothetical protein
MEKFAMTVALLLAVPLWVSAQDPDELYYRAEGYTFFAAGPAILPPIPIKLITSPPPPRPVVEHVGAGGEFFLSRRLALGPELGYAHWGPFDQEGGVGCVDALYHFGAESSGRRVDPFALAGYTLMFNRSYRGNGANFGGGVSLWMAKHAALRLEIRDEVGRAVSPTMYSGVLEFRAGLTFR